MKSFDANNSGTVRKRRVFGAVFASSRAVSRDILHTTRSLYRRSHVNELVATIEPIAPVIATKPLATRDEDGAIQSKTEYDGDLVLQLNQHFPEASVRVNEYAEQSDSIHRTPALPFEDDAGGNSNRTDLSSLFPRPPSFSKSKDEFNLSSSKRSFVAPLPSDRYSQDQMRPQIPPRKDSLAHQNMLLSVIDETTKGGLRESRQSVTAYVSADYEGKPTPLTFTSWLEDPDGPPDEMASWNRSVTARQPGWPTGPSPARPKMAPRSKTTPVYSTADIWTPETTDVHYERVLREKLRHHAGQVKKRLDTSTYYLSTVRRDEIEVHLAFVQAAEKVLKQSPIWVPEQLDKIKYLLEA